MALGHLGHSVLLTDVETDTTLAADGCRLFYDQVVGEVFRDIAFPISTRTEALVLEEEDPTTEWAYSYRVPNACHQMRRVLNGSGARDETEASRVRYRIAGDDEGPLLYTDQADAVAEYSALIEDPELYPADVAQTIALLLAAYLAPTVGGPNAERLGARAFQLYAIRASAAARNAYNEETPDAPPTDSFTASRT